MVTPERGLAQEGGAGGGSHHVSVRRLQVAVAARLRLVGRRRLVALLVEPVHSVPDVGRIGHPL